MSDTRAMPDAYMIAKPFFITVKGVADCYVFHVAHCFLECVIKYRIPVRAYAYTVFRFKDVVDIGLFSVVYS